MMKTIILSIILNLASYGVCEAQTKENPVSVQIEKLEKEKEDVTREEKQKLETEVEAINRRLEQGEISEEEAESLKDEATKKHALNIENRTSILQNKIDWLEENQEAEESEWEQSSQNSAQKRYDQRTYMSLIIAAGLNNALKRGEPLDDSEYKLAGSRFFEIGLDWKTRVFYDSNWLRLRYGFSFQFNGLKPSDNRYFVEDENLTVLEEFPLDLEKSKFRMDNLVFPVHLEFGPYKRVETRNRVRFSTSNQLKMGLGGYAGFNIGERQKLKYKEDGDRVKEKIKNDFNTNSFIYGLSGYIGWGWIAVYAKYDLNPIFEEPNPEKHNMSLGLRFNVN